MKRPEDAPWIQITEAHLRRAAHLAATNGTTREAFLIACAMAWDEDETAGFVGQIAELRTLGRVGTA